MPLTLRTVTNADAPLCAPDGTVLANKRVTFTIISPSSGKPVDVWDAETEQRVVGVVATTTDAAGEFSVDLWPNSRGDKATKYLCEVDHPGVRAIRGSVPEGGADLEWVDFYANSEPLTPQGLDALQAHIADTSEAHQASAIGGLAAFVLATTLTGFAVPAAADVTASDSILSAFGKVQAQLNAIEFTAGSDTQIIFNSGGALTGSPSLTFDTQAEQLTVNANIAVTGGYGLTTDFLGLTGDLLAGGWIVAGDGDYFGFNGSTRLHDAGNGNLRLTNNAGDSFGRLQFGGTTTSFPALKRNGAGLDVRLADDSAYAVLGATLAAGGNAILTSDAANILAQRNGTSAQEFRAYNTYTDASNYERGFFRYASNTMQIGHEAAGTGTASRSLHLMTGGTVYLGMNSASGLWNISNGGALFPASTGARAFGTTAQRIMAGYFGGNTLTTSLPMLDLAQTWNAGAVTFTAALVNVTDTASASASLLLDLQVASSSVFSVRKSGLVTAAGGFTSSAGNLQLGSGIVAFGASSDVVLTRGAADVLELRRSTNPQVFHVYGTYTDASNYNRLMLGWESSTSISVGCDQAGTGVKRQLVLQGATIGFRPLSASSSMIWAFSTSGHLTAVGADNTYDIGAAGAQRPRNAYLGTSLTVGGAAAITTNAPALSVAQTWNAGAVTFTGMLVNITNTASAATSMVAEFQVGGSSVLSIRKDGVANASGYVVAGTSGVAAIGTGAGVSGLNLGSAGVAGWTASAGAVAAVDTSLRRTAAGVLAVRADSAANGGALEFLEQTAPAAGAANTVRLYAEDNGAGKTRLMAIFNSGAAQQVAIEP
jgi:hypothetical protein